MFSAQLDPASLRDFQRTLQRLADATDRPVEEVLRQQGRLLANDLAFHVAPRGFSSATGRSFKQSIKRQITRFYRPIGWLHNELENLHNLEAADFVVRLIRTGRHQEAQRVLNGRLRLAHRGAILVAPFDGGSLHRRFRWRRTSGHPLLVVTRFSDVNAYVRETTAMAGFAKGSLINAGRQLDGKTGTGSRKPNKWILDHFNAPGRGILARQRGGFSGFVQTLIRYARQALPPHLEVQALRVRQQTAEKQLARIVDANIRRAMRGA